MIYLDNNATTRVADEVLAAMQPYSTQWYGNPHSSHTLGRAAHDGLERARTQVAALLGAEPERIRFTSCGTEGNAIVITGMKHSSPRRRIVATAVEHPSVLRLLERMQQRGDAELVLVSPAADGSLDPARFAEAIDETTSLVCVMLAQNETGVIHAVREIAEVAHRHSAHVLVDAVQAAGKIALDVRELGADYVTISGHKLHAPKGIGALWIREELELEPLWLGGGQEFGLRAGTEPVSAAVGLGEACRLAAEHLTDAPRIAELRDGLESILLRAFPEARVHGAAVERLPNTSSIGFPGIIGASLVAQLDELGHICISSGSACHSGSAEPSAILSAMSVTRDVALGTVRLSLSRYTTADEISTASRHVINAVTALRAGTLQESAS